MQVLIGIALYAMTGVAVAQVSPEAEALFREGKSLIRQGKIPEACDAFAASEAVEHSLATVLSLADCRERNHQYASAWVLFLQADSQTRSDPGKAALNRTARTRAAATERRLSYLTVAVPGGSRMEGLTLTRNGAAFEPARWNRALPVDGGDYVIVARAPTAEAWQTTAHVGDEAARVTVEIPKLKAVVAPIGVGPSPDRARTASAMVPDPVRGTSAATAVQEGRTVVTGSAGVNARLTSRRVLALWLAGAGVVSGVTGVLLGASASAKQDDAYRRCPTASMPCAEADRANALLGSARTRALGANVVFGVGAALAVGAGVLWWIGAPATEARHVRVWPSLSPDHTGLVFEGDL